MHVMHCLDYGLRFLRITEMLLTVLFMSKLNDLSLPSVFLCASCRLTGLLFKKLSLRRHLKVSEYQSSSSEYWAVSTFYRQYQSCNQYLMRNSVNILIAQVALFSKMTGLYLLPLSPFVHVEKHLCTYVLFDRSHNIESQSCEQNGS